MATIRDALVRKKVQNPQYAYLWRVELPMLMNAPDPTSSGAAGNYAFNTNALNSGGLGGLITQARSFIDTANRQITQGMSTINDTVNGLFNDLGMTSMLPQLAGVGFSGSDLDEISHRVYEISTPYRSYNVEKATHKITHKGLAGHRDISSVNMTVDEMEDNKTLLYFLKWMSMIENEDGTRNPYGFYKFPIKFVRVSTFQLDLMGSEYIGCFPSEINPVNNSYDATGITQYTVVLSVDDVRHYSPVEALASSGMLENDLLMREYRSSGFNLGNFDARKQTAILTKIANAVF